VTDPSDPSTADDAVHRIAAAAVVRDGQVLLVHRHPRRRDFPDCWNIVGGHIEPGETPADAIRRECREELGIDIDDARPIPMTVAEPQTEMHAFLVTSWSGHPENTAPDEHDELRWFDPTELGDLVLAHPASLPDLVAAAIGSGSGR
jgi:mutator protein MutT